KLIHKFGHEIILFLWHNITETSGTISPKYQVVSVLPQTNPKTRKTPIPVHLFIEEAPRLTTRFGAGYGTEDQFRAFLDFGYKGFLGGARQLKLNLKHSSLEPYSASLKWIQPQFLTKKSSITLNPFIIKNSEPGYVTQTFGLNVPITYRFSDDFSSTLTYYLERVKQDVGQGYEEIPHSGDGIFPYNKSGILVSTRFNNSKPQFFPTQGITAFIGFKLNGYLLGSDFNYNSLWAEFRTYYEIGDVVIAFRILTGGIHSADTSQFIPVEDRFYSGGSNSVRGWNRSDLGPKRSNGSPLGGKSVMEGNLEARYPLFWKVSGVAFLDAGNVWTESYTYKLKELAYAVGGGIRVETPIGPIRFDVGFPVWNEKKKPQFFISVGQAF
ncbi:autotransporter assembly complex protein TamA, partial [Williamwhitmania taraxaci]